MTAHAELIHHNMHEYPRYGILGGTFDPPHLGHLVLAQEAHARLRLHRVWFLPAASPPHKTARAISAPEHRAAMTAAAIAGDTRFALSRVDLDRAGPSYTVETLGLLRERWGAKASLVLILGWDMLISLPTWHDGAGVVARADEIAAAHRPGFSPGAHELDELEAQLPGLHAKLVLIPAPQLDLAATTIRERVALALPIRYLIPDAVREYIEREGLYRDQAGAQAPAAQHTEGEALA